MELSAFSFLAALQSQLMTVCCACIVRDFVGMSPFKFQDMFEQQQLSLENNKIN